MKKYIQFLLLQWLGEDKWQVIEETFELKKPTTAGIKLDIQK